MRNINSVTLTGNLTKDPELRHTPSGVAVTTLRIAVNESFKDSTTGEWRERGNFFDVVVWGGQAEACAEYLAKGRPIALQGRLQWREWETQDGGKRQTVEVVANQVQFLGSRENGGGSGYGAPPPPDDFAPTTARDGSSFAAPEQQEQAAADDFAPSSDFAPAHGDDDIAFGEAADSDIPF